MAGDGIDTVRLSMITKLPSIMTWLKPPVTRKSRLRREPLSPSRVWVTVCEAKVVVFRNVKEIRPGVVAFQTHEKSPLNRSHTCP